MKVLSATQNQAEILNGSYINNSIINFELDANGNYVINQNVLNDDDFIKIRESLLNLPLIEYKPIIYNE
jgi:hypothetical protein